MYMVKAMCNSIVRISSKNKSDVRDRRRELSLPMHYFMDMRHRERTKRAGTND
ncbi:Uncharacterised protein [Burkholderia pseudomallei]|nr:Uncharacterised protein [Burkholderia pseudomallei]CAJ5188812.1 Uncharacterised protein [Burkholderia pseudomallei]CAJ5783871.1 Uncharacterised protein [Burkholderia pseudomallei]CAJ6336519.1 Uncharacterised protein [Burkholderia pseudomallei]CAJ6594041.1 Uncharacterised protein [Burkholderia pseudomallei]